MKFLLIIFFLAAAPAAYAQQGFRDSLQAFRQKYISSHEVVTGDNRKNFSFHPITSEMRVVARFEKLQDTAGFIMKTSGAKTQRYFRYGRLHFTLFRKQLTLTIYQGEKQLNDSAYKNYLFVPFTDQTSGELSYGGGRYLDFTTEDIKNDLLLLDFNKAYNPYCAYAKGYNCPVPPAENDLPVPIPAGEASFQDKH